MRLAACLITAALSLQPCCALAQSTAHVWDPARQTRPLPAAFGGYSIVALRDRHEWQPGDERYSVFFDGQRYQFATPRERDIFAAAPLSYAPMLGGDCPVTFAETGERVAGQLDFGILHGQRLVFFTSEEHRQYFLEQPSQFSMADLAISGRCIVSRRMRGKDVAGIPETAALYRGMRYWFASAHDRALFLENPGRFDGSGPGGPETIPEAQVIARADEDPTSRPSPWSLPSEPGKDGQGQGAGERDVLLGSLPAISGYCPVTLRNEGLWVRGRYEHRVELDGLVFLTSGPNERDALRTDPVKYVPALGGDCAVSFVNRGERLRGSVYQAFEYEGRLFLFVDGEQKAAFKANPERYASADWAAGGVCVVTRAEQGREAPGAADQAAWHRGKLYRFAGAEQKQKFLADPEKYAVK
ncbi:MAG TPA: hypothetical protein VF175_05085 [Lacipirellula sp.]